MCEFCETNKLLSQSFDMKFSSTLFFTAVVLIFSISIACYDMIYADPFVFHLPKERREKTTPFIVAFMHMSLR